MSLGIIICMVVLTLVGLDFAYSRVTMRCLRRWECDEVVRDDNGIRCDCAEFNLGEGDVALLLVHGFGDSPAIWQRMAPALAARGYHCRGMRLPGFAEVMAKYQQTGLEAWKTAFHAEVAALRKRHRQVWAVGHSMGGALSFNALATGLGSVDGLILLAPLVKVSSKRSPLLPAHVWFHLLNRTLLFTNVLMTAFDPDLYDRSVRSLLRTDRFVPIAVYRAMFQLMRENRRCSLPDAPILAILSKNDAVVDSSEAAMFFVDESGRNIHHVWSDKAGHVLPMDFGWQEHVDGIHRFVNANTPTADE